LIFILVIEYDFIKICHAENLKILAMHYRIGLLWTITFFCCDVSASLSIFVVRVCKYPFYYQPKTTSLMSATMYKNWLQKYYGFRA